MSAPEGGPDERTDDDRAEGPDSGPAEGSASDAASRADDTDHERVNVFHVGDDYLFRHYFEGDEVFEKLKPYYEHQEYRFSVPAHKFEPLQVSLRDRGYDLRVVEDPEEFGVVVRKYRSHPENVFKAAVLQRSTRDHNVFFLRDRHSVAQAVKQGGTRLVDTDIEIELE